MHPSTKTTNSSFDKAHASALYLSRGRWILLRRVERGWVQNNPEWVFELYPAKGNMADACWIGWGDPRMAWVKKVDRVWWGRIEKIGHGANLPRWAQPAHDHELVLLSPTNVELSVPALIAWGAQRVAQRGLLGIRTSWMEHRWSQGSAWKVHPQWDGEGPVPGTGAGCRWRRTTDDRSIKATVTLAAKALLEASSLLEDDVYRGGEHWRVVVAAALHGWATQLDDIAVRDPDYSFQRGRCGVGWKEQKRRCQWGRESNAWRCARDAFWGDSLDDVADLEPQRRW